jgi:hypothetical protein
MNSVEQFQKHAQEQNEAAMSSASAFAENAKTITTAHAEYTKKGIPGLLRIHFEADQPEIAG